MLGNKLRQKPIKNISQGHSFSFSIQKKKYLKKSELVQYLDSYLLQSKPQFLPNLEKKVQKSFPLKTIKPVHTLYAPFQGDSQIDQLLTRVLSKGKKKPNAFSDIKRKSQKLNKKRENLTKSQDDKILMYIKGIDKRPKSVNLNKKVSCIMQTDDFL